MELAGAYTEVCLETDIFRNGNGVNFKLVTTLWVYFGLRIPMETALKFTRRYTVILSGREHCGFSLAERWQRGKRTVVVTILYSAASCYDICLTILTTFHSSKEVKQTRSSPSSTHVPYEPWRAGWDKTHHCCCCDAQPGNFSSLAPPPYIMGTVSWSPLWLDGRWVKLHRMTLTAT
jgi:hypothetical protein